MWQVNTPQASAFFTPQPKILWDGCETASIVSEVDTSPPESVNQQKNSENQADTPSRDSSLEREVIEILKQQVHTKDEQLRTKDGQIKDLSDQMKGVNDLNIKLVGQNVHQATRIQELLQLTTKSKQHTDAVTKVDDNNPDFVNDFVNRHPDLDNNLDAGVPHAGHHTDSASGGEGSRMAA